MTQKSFIVIIGEYSPELSCVREVMDAPKEAEINFFDMPNIGSKDTVERVNEQLLIHHYAQLSEFEIQVKNKVGVPDDIWEDVKADVIGDITSMSDEMLQKLPYSQLTEGAYDSAYRSASSQIENESKETVKAIQKNIEKSAKEVTDMIDEALDDLVKNWGF